MTSKQIKVQELKVGDRFKDLIPNAIESEYIVSWTGHGSIEAHPVWDKDAEQMVKFHWLEIVQIEVK